MLEVKVMNGIKKIEYGWEYLCAAVRQPDQYNPVARMMGSGIVKGFIVNLNYGDAVTFERLHVELSEYSAEQIADELMQASNIYKDAIAKALEVLVDAADEKPYEYEYILLKDLYNVFWEAIDDIRFYKPNLVDAVKQLLRRLRAYKDSL